MAQTAENVIDINTVKTEDGKDYRTVCGRLKAFRAGPYGDCGIETEVLAHGERPRVKATIRDPFGGILATGHAEELRNSSDVNRTAALQNAETSAIGRALMFGGLMPVLDDNPYVQIEGILYERVLSRLLDFRRDYPRYGILTAVLLSEEGRYVTQAKITASEGRVLAMGHDEIVRGANGEGKDLEESETSAVGRALAVLGYASTDAVASAEEAQRAVSLRNGNRNPHKDPKPPARSRAPRTEASASAGAAEAPPTRDDTAPGAPEASGSAPTEPLLALTKKLAQAGFVDVSEKPPEESKVHESRFIVGKLDGVGFLLQAKTRAKKAILETLGFTCRDAGKGLWSKEVASAM